MELWVNILTRLDADAKTLFAWDQTAPRAVAQKHRNMQQLRLVCTALNTALDAAQLSHCLFVQKMADLNFLPDGFRGPPPDLLGYSGIRHCIGQRALLTAISRVDHPL